MENITYKEFIQNILETRGRFVCGNEYHERHHIIPKCIGGTNEEENLIDLYAREHFIAHKLLALENPENNKLVYAWWNMCQCKGKSSNREDVAPEEYEEARKSYINIIRGRHRTEETKKKISESKQGEHLSEETKNKISESLKGKNNPNYGKQTSEETRKKISKANKGRKHTKEAKKKMSESRTGQRIGENHPMFGKHHTEEAKKKISEANKGKMAGKNHPNAIAVVQYDKSFKLIRVWNYIKQATEYLKIDNADIGKCCMGKSRTAGGFIWRYLYDQTRKDGTIIPGAITQGLITEEETLRQLNNNT